MKPTITQYKTEINASLVSYSDSLLSDRQAIIFIHGFPLNKSMWNEQLNRFGNQYRTIAYDVRGHGESSISDGQYNLDLYVEDLVALISHLELEQPIVCGLSMGGYIALRTLERYPGLFAAVILCDTQSAADDNKRKEKRFKTIKKIKEEGVRGFCEEFSTSLVSEETYSEHPEKVQRIRDMICSNSAVGICGTLSALASRPDLSDMLSDIKIPTLLLFGEEDRITPPETGMVMQRQIPGSKFYLIPEAAHLPNIENTGEFNKRLSLFLDKITKNTPVYGNDRT